MTDPRKEKVTRLGLEREDGFAYFVKAGAIWRTRQPKDRGVPSEKVLETGVVPEAGYTYFLDPDGDLSRVPRGSSTPWDDPPTPPAPATGAPVTFAHAFTPLLAHVGEPVFLVMPAAAGGLRQGRRAITIFDWSKLDADTRAMFAESQILELASALGRGWDGQQVPFALVGGESHPVPLDELDQQTDGVLIIELASGAVLYCDDATSRAATPIAASTGALTISADEE